MRSEELRCYAEIVYVSIYHNYKVYDAEAHQITLEAEKLKLSIGSEFQIYRFGSTLQVLMDIN